MNNFHGRRSVFWDALKAWMFAFRSLILLHLIGTYLCFVAGIVGNIPIIFRGGWFRQDCGASAQRASGVIGKGWTSKRREMEVPLEAI